MLPPDQIRFLTGPTLSLVGTRNRQLRPSVSWVTAVRAEAETDTMSFLLPDVESERIKSDIQDNGMIAITIVEPKSHETYQFKGKALSQRAANLDDRALADIQVAKIATRLDESRYRGDLFRRFVFWPGTVITFRVSDIFIQTPGPMAGKRIEFPKVAP